MPPTENRTPALPDPDVAIVADTHGSDGHRLAGRARYAVDRAPVVCHAGDFTTPSVYDAFEAVADEFVAVSGNNDAPELHERLSATATVDAFDRRLVLVHGHEHDDTSLSLLAREAEADLAVVGHSHVAGIDDLGETTVVNPGSHADPRGRPPTHAELHRDGGEVIVRVVRRDGTVHQRGVV